VFATPYDVALDSLRRSYSEPEGKLILAILDDAIACFQKYALARDRKGQILFQEAEDWVQETNSDWPFSFVNVCEILGFDPDYLRQGLCQWKAAKLESRTKGKIHQLASRNGRPKHRHKRYRQTTFAQNY
jgi:hypothetical protein